jgi:hypothetical protein
MKTAICDLEAFVPFRRLVSGPLTNSGDLPHIERFVRTVVLHDDMVIVPRPLPFRPNENEYEMPLGTINAQELSSRGSITFHVDLHSHANGRVSAKSTADLPGGFDFIRIKDSTGSSDIALPASLIALVTSFAKAPQDSRYSRAHVEFLCQIMATIKNGGSALLLSDFGQQAIDTVQRYPAELFSTLDADWQRYARSPHYTISHR